MPVRFGADQESYLLLDTGSNLTHVPAAILHQVPAAGRRLTAAGDIHGKFHIATSILCQTMKLGTLTDRDIPLMPCTSEGPAVLGTDVLRRFLVTIDCHNNRLLLDRTTRSLGSAGIEGDTGIALQQDESGFFARRVKGDSVASSAGIRNGHRILDVEGQPLRLLTWAAAQSMVDGIADRPHRLVISGRQRNRTEVLLTPRNPYRNAKSAILGFTLEWSTEDGLRVEEVFPSSVAFRKGLRTGDVIRKVNDLAVAEAPIQYVFAELATAIVRLEKVSGSGESLVVELAAE